MNKEYAEEGWGSGVPCGRKIYPPQPLLGMKSEWMCVCTEKAFVMLAGREAAQLQ